VLREGAIVLEITNVIRIAIVITVSVVSGDSRIALREGATSYCRSITSVIRIAIVITVMMLDGDRTFVWRAITICWS
jgi:hypothetical protein